jgi:tetratricopeptide (TPR) repeat protein
MPGPARRAARRWQATLIVALFLAAVVSAAAVGWWYARESPPHQGPILLVSADEVSAADLSIYGAGQTAGAAIESLASDSVVFDRAYAHSPQSLPAHASVLSGQLPMVHGVRDDAGFSLPDNASTLAELLRSRGFATGAAVSSFLLQKRSGLAQGFDFFDDAIPSGPPAEALSLERPGVETIDTAEQWLSTQSDQRFFLFVQVAARDADAAVFRLSSALKRQDWYDDATLVFVGSRGDVDSGLSLDDRALRVPLVVKQPNSDGRGRRVDAPVQHVDLLPTILDWVRAPLPEGLPGRSLRPMLDDEDGAVPEAFIYAESMAPHFRFGVNGLYALMDDTFRYARGAGEELVPLTGSTDTHVGQAAEAGRLRTGLDELLAGADSGLPAPIPPAEIERYALAGYLGTSLSSPETITLDEAALGRLAAAHRGAAVLVGQKQYAAGIRALRVLVSDHPSLPSLRHQLATVLIHAGRIEEAIEELSALRQLRPESSAIARDLAEALLRVDRFEPAREQAEAAVALASSEDPATRVAAHMVAARIALADEDPDGARHHAERARAIDPALPVVELVEGRLLHQEGRCEEAVDMLGRAAHDTDRLGTDLPDLYFHLGESLVCLERYTEAEAAFREQLRRDRRHIPAYTSLALLYRASHQQNAVEDVLNELVAVAPTPEGYSVAARLWTVLGDPPRAEALRSDARSRFRGDPSLALLGRDRRR